MQCVIVFLFFKQKTAYEMRISDWSSDVCATDLAGRNPDDGRNAIVAAAEIAVRLAAERRPTLAVNPARIEGGGPNNVVPDLAALRVNFRPKAADEIVRARAALDAAVAAVTAKSDVRIDVHGSFNRRPKPIAPGHARLFDLVTRSK